MENQVSIFDGTKQFKIDKPIRLIELFGGYGSQHFALEYLGVEFEQWKLCEWAVKSIQAYKDAHCQDDTDYSKDLTKQQIVEFLANKGISADYNKPMTYEQVKRLSEEKLRTIYNNIKATHNLVNIQQAHAKDFEILDTDKYCYMMTYSFPCQDLSKAGLGKGMAKDSGTRSGMLWEVERILDECENLPQVLVMENVPDVIGTKNIEHFAKWLEKLENLGYHCYWQVLNAKDYGVPQNRERCFMVSILGDYYYEFPKKMKLEKRLKDVLESEVDEKYYLSDKMIKYIQSPNEKYTGNNNRALINRDIGVAITTRVGNTRCDCSDYICGELPNNFDIKLTDRMDDNFIKINGKQCMVTNDNENFIQWKMDGFLDSDCRAWKSEKVSGTITTNGKNKIIDNEPVAFDEQNNYIRKDGCVGTLTTDGSSPKHNNRVIENYRIRKLTPKECFRLMGVKDYDFEKISKNQSNASLYHLAGDSIVVDVLVAIFKNML